MFKNDTALPHCIAIDKSWNKYIVSLGSLIALVICLPIFLNCFDGFLISWPRCFDCYWRKNVCGSNVHVLHAFQVSCTICSGTSDNKSVFQVWISKRVWNGYISGQWFTLWPWDECAPSGHFPSVLDKPAGSLDTGISAHLIDLQMMSFSSACHCCRALLRLHDSPCRPLAFTSFSHGQVWSSHVQSPNLKPMAIRIISTLSLNPIDVIGGATSQSPEWEDDADRMRALSTFEESWDEISANWLLMTGWSQTFCMCRTYYPYYR